VHVAPGDRDLAGRDAAREKWVTSASLPVERDEAAIVKRDLLALSGLVRQLEEGGVEDRAAPDHRAFAEEVAADLVDLDAEEPVSGVT